MMIPSLILLTALGVSEPPNRIELSTIPRTIKHEPRYAHPSPLYCLLVFGPQAKSRVWIVLDGTRCFIDRNKNGDLRETGEMVQNRSTTFYLGEVSEGSPTIVHKNLRIWGDRISGFRLRVTSHRLGSQYVGFRDEQRVKFSTSPSTAPIIHFDGPLTFARYSSIVTVPRKPRPDQSYRETYLRYMLGSPGLGQGTFASCHCRRAHKCGPLMGEFVYRAPNEKQIKYRQKLLTRN